MTRRILFVTPAPLAVEKIRDGFDYFHVRFANCSSLGMAADSFFEWIVSIEILDS